VARILRLLVNKVETAIIILLVTIVVGVPPVFATFCEVSNLTYDYPKQVMQGQSVITAVSVSGVCAADDADYYSVRVDITGRSGEVLSVSSVPTGYSQGQTWTVTAQNQVIAPYNVGSWEIRFVVYIFAAVGGGGLIDSVTINPVVIQIG
jgi:hypothetical protein